METKYIILTKSGRVVGGKIFDSYADAVQYLLDSKFDIYNQWIKITEFFNNTWGGYYGE